MQPSDPINLRLGDLGIEECDLQFLLGDFTEHVTENLETPIWWEICEQVHNSTVVFSEGNLPHESFLSEVDAKGQQEQQISKSLLRMLLLPSVMGMRGRCGIMNLGAVGVEVHAGMGLQFDCH